MQHIIDVDASSDDEAQQPQGHSVMSLAALSAHSTADLVASHHSSVISSGSIGAQRQSEGGSRESATNPPPSATQAHTDPPMELNCDVPIFLNDIPTIPITPLPIATGVDGPGDRRSVSLSLNDVLAHRQWETVVFSNYMTDLEFLANSVPSLFVGPARARQLVFISGEEDRDHIVSVARSLGFDHRSVVVTRPPLPIPFGTHHSKGILAFTNDLSNGSASLHDPTEGLRVVITTSNFIYDDVLRKNQALYCQDFPPSGRRAAHPTSAGGSDKRQDNGVRSQFGADLKEYFQATGATGIVQRLEHYDFSAAACHLVGSVPGYHNGQALQRWGMNKMKGVVGQCGRDRASSSSSSASGARRSPAKANETVQLKEVAAPRACGTSRGLPDDVGLSWQYSSQGSLNDRFLRDLAESMMSFHGAFFVSSPAPTHDPDATVQQTSSSSTKRPRSSSHLGSNPAAAAAQTAAPQVESSGGGGNGTCREIAVRNRRPFRSSADFVHVVFPSVSEVRCSVEGWRGGMSIPVPMKNHFPAINPCLRRWAPRWFRSNTELDTFGLLSKDDIVARCASLAVPPPALLSAHDGSQTGLPASAAGNVPTYALVAGRHRAMPHIKSYCRIRKCHLDWDTAALQRLLQPPASSSSAITGDASGSNGGGEEYYLKKLLRSSADWVYITSSNLSRAAWGERQKNDAQLAIRSYELGVVFSPDLPGVDNDSFSCTPHRKILPLGRCSISHPSGSGAVTSAPTSSQLPALMDLCFSSGVHCVRLGSWKSTTVAASEGNASSGETDPTAARFESRAFFLPYDPIDPDPYGREPTGRDDSGNVRDTPWSIDFPHDGRDILRQPLGIIAEHSHYGSDGWSAPELKWAAPTHARWPTKAASSAPSASDAQAAAVAVARPGVGQRLGSSSEAPARQLSEMSRRPSYTIL